MADREDRPLHQPLTAPGTFNPAEARCRLPPPFAVDLYSGTERQTICGKVLGH